MIGAIKASIRPIVMTVYERSRPLFAPRYLLLTNTLISSGMSAAGDAVIQTYQISCGQMDSWNWRRSIKVAATGFLVGPIVHYWYILLDWWIPGSSFRVVVKKTLADQFISSPIYISIFLLSIGIVEKKSWQEIKDSFGTKGPKLLTADWIVWPPAQLINFFFLPTRYRVLYDNTISFGFDCFYSFVQYPVGNLKKAKAIKKEDNEL